MQQQMMQYNNAQAQAAAQQAMDLERELLAMRGQYERDQLMLEQYDRVCGASVYAVKSIYSQPPKSLRAALFHDFSRPIDQL